MKEQKLIAAEKECL